jgi:DNA-binding CsgD family transcriptional regulator
MRRSQTLTLGQVAAVFRLVLQACELGKDPAAWRRHVLTELSRQIGTVHAASMVLPGPFDRGGGPLLYFVEVGDCGGPSRDGRAGHGAAYCDGVPPAVRRNEQLYSHLPLPVFGCASAFAFTRSLGDPPFSHADRRLVQLFHHELGRLWATPPLSHGPWDDVQLSPRLAETLRRLMAGDSEKQVAGHLRLSRHTVHDYVKELHRRFGATSLGELHVLARPVQRFRPHLGI